MSETLTPQSTAANQTPLERLQEEIVTGEYTLAALVTVQSRFTRGNHTPYGTFLCEYLWDPREYTPAPPITRRAPSGIQYDFNNPMTTLKSFTAEGHFVQVRRAQDFDPSRDDEAASFFVATADLAVNDAQTGPLDVNKGRIIEWTVAAVERKRDGKRHLSLEADDWNPQEYPPLKSVETPADVLQAAIDRRQKFGKLTAHLILSQDQGGLLVPPGPGNSLQEMHQAEELVRQVNQLTTAAGLTGEDLERISRQYEEQMRAQPAERPYLRLAA
jgi:hypothetical protein